MVKTITMVNRYRKHSNLRVTNIEVGRKLEKIKDMDFFNFEDRLLDRKKIIFSRRTSDEAKFGNHAVSQSERMSQSDEVGQDKTDWGESKDRPCLDDGSSSSLFLIPFFLSRRQLHVTASVDCEPLVST